MTQRAETMIRLRSRPKTTNTICGLGPGKVTRERVLRFPKSMKQQRMHGLNSIVFTANNTADAFSPAHFTPTT